jgi:hypothetical protein
VFPINSIGLFIKKEEKIFTGTHFFVTGTLKFKDFRPKKSGGKKKS